ncbi:MAG: recombinase family protein [Scandinavium sp.]|uniref:recombinase family protein n=1 Tax=Scandinavium sp. TaxID=2830653 RepID=UPI003F375314
MRTAISKAREGDIFVVAAIDRLGRNAVDVLNTTNEIAAMGARLVSLREGFDLSTPVGKMMLNMMAGFAEMERNLTDERRLAGMARARAEGVHMGRPRHPHEEEIRNMSADGLRYGEIVRVLESKGIKAGKTRIYSFKCISSGLT